MTQFDVVKVGKFAVIVNCPNGGLDWFVIIEVLVANSVQLWALLVSEPLQVVARESPGPGSLVANSVSELLQVVA